jgi:hypothetical protein
MEQQSAVEWLVRKLSTELIGEIQLHRWDEIRNVIQQAKEMEKKQIVEAFYQGVDQESDTHGAMNLDRKDAENYYNETFKTK